MEPYKGDEIKIKTLIGSVEMWRLNMIDLTSFIHYIKLKWIKRIFDNPSGSWQKFLSYVFNIKCNTPECIWDLNRDRLLELKKRTSNYFWKSVIDSLNMVKPKDVLMHEYICSDIRNFCPFSDFEYYTHWIQNGMNSIKTLFTEEGEMTLYLLAVRFGEILCRRDVQNESANQSPLRPYLLTDRHEKHKLGRGP